MKIKPQCTGTGPLQTRVARGTMMAAILCSGWLTVYGALAQEGVESAALTKGGASAPAAVGKGPMQMTISMAPVAAAAPAAARAAARTELRRRRARIDQRQRAARQVAAGADAGAGP